MREPLDRTSPPPLDLKRLLDVTGRLYDGPNSPEASSVSSVQASLFEVDQIKPVLSRDHVSSTFIDNMSLPVHRWFRYSAGFSAAWAKTVIESQSRDRNCRVLDPFAGSGTVLLAAQACGRESAGLDMQPFVARVARAKLSWETPVREFETAAAEVLLESESADGRDLEYPDLIRRCYTDDVLAKLDALRRSVGSLDRGARTTDLVWLALAAILRPTSHAGTAQWQYVLPAKTKLRVLDPFAAFRAQVNMMSADMLALQDSTPAAVSQVFESSAAKPLPVPDGWATLVLTSPPYANNYDYADATRLEMTFFGDAKGWGDLRGIRQQLVRSCTQQATGKSREVAALLEHPVLEPIRAEILAICSSLELVRESKGGRKPYHGMIAGYFIDMGLSFQHLRSKCTPGCVLCYVIGDSAPYGVHVPVEQWLGRLAQAAGFGAFRFEKTRDRNNKWRNRKHDVPLHEGRLWIEG
jgi:hypothetical protein